MSEPSTIATWVNSAVPKASTLLADELRTHIVRERLEAGSPFPSETELIASSGYSRATVREAMRLLEADGLIVTRRGPGGGVRVGKPSLGAAAQSIAINLSMSNATVRDMFTYRRSLEREAARLAAANATPEQIAALKRETHSHDKPVREVIGFHGIIADSTGNDFFRAAMQVMLHIANWHTPFEGIPAEVLREAEAAHQKVVHCIEQGDGDAAANAMDEHLAAYMRILEERGELDEPIIRSPQWGDSHPA